MRPLITRIQLLALVLALAVLVGACTSSEAAPPADDPALAPAEPDDPDYDAGWPSMAIDWYGDFLLELPNGWTVLPCEGDAPLICFADGDRHVGSVEIGDWPLPDDYDGDARSYLHSHAEDLIAGMREDRSDGCAHLTFEEVPAIDVTVGGLRGVKAGFRMVDGDGVEMERHVLYWAVHDGAHFVINAAAYDDSCLERMGEFETHDLGIVVTYLDRIVEESPLPSASGEPGAGPLEDGEYTARIVTLDAPVKVAYLGMVDLLSGREAVDAAKHDGVLGADENELPNDVYVRDHGQGTVAIRIAAGAEVSVYDCSAACRHVPVDLADLLAGKARAMNGVHAVFEVTVDGGEIVAITEIYLP